MVGRNRPRDVACVSFTAATFHSFAAPRLSAIPQPVAGVLDFSEIPEGPAPAKRLHAQPDPALVHKPVAMDGTLALRVNSPEMAMRTRLQMPPVQRQHV